MILTLPTRKHPRWFGYIGSFTTYRPIPRACPRTQARHGYRKASYLASNIQKRRKMGARSPPIAPNLYYQKPTALKTTPDQKGAKKSKTERKRGATFLADAELTGTFKRGARYPRTPTQNRRRRL